MSIIISENGKKAQKIDKSDFEKEGYLQNYIHQNPESIPVYEIEVDKKLFVVAREFSTESGPIDALAVDKDGDIYVVETKLYKNPDKRTVVAQALDYGASLWRHSDYNEFIAEINDEINKKFNLNFEEKTQDFFDLDDEQIIIMLEAIKKNLQQGNIKFVVLMDTIDDRLKDLIVYINQNSKFDIFAVQMEYYKYESKLENYEIMIPKLFGVEVKKGPGITSNNDRKIKIWDEDEFLIDAKDRLTDEQYNAVEKIFNFSKHKSDGLVMGKGAGRASVFPLFYNFSDRSFFGIKSNGKLEFKIGWALSKAKDQDVKNKLELLSQKLEQIGVPAPIGKHSINHKIEKWFNKVDKILEVFNEIIK